MSLKKLFATFLLMTGFAISVTNTVEAYPLDGTKYTGIQRLEGMRLGQTGKVRSRKLHPGALLTLNQVRPRLFKAKGMQIPLVDKQFSAEVKKLLRAPSYGIAVLDLSDLKNPVYAEHNADRQFNPGSVGKLAVAMGVFKALKEIHPRDIKARENLLRRSLVTADGFMIKPSHAVPFWQPNQKRVNKRKLKVGDTASLWTYMDWMMSASSNSAASMVIKQLMLLEAFTKSYPGYAYQRKSYFNGPRRDLSDMLRYSLNSGVRASGLSTDNFRQGGFFTSGGKRRVSGGSSTATPRALMKFLFNLERGKVIDPFSSREIKRLLYMTQKRIRYASSPALNDAAVYFKSGSLYSCRAEAGFSCGKYRGNVRNILNSVAIVESPAGYTSDKNKKGLFYMAVVTSNVLRHNAAFDHQTLATRLHRLIEKRHQLTKPPELTIKSGQDILLKKQPAAPKK